MSRRFVVVKGANEAPRLAAATGRNHQGHTHRHSRESLQDECDELAAIEVWGEDMEIELECGEVEHLLGDQQQQLQLLQPAGRAEVKEAGEVGVALAGRAANIDEVQALQHLQPRQRGPGDKMEQHNNSNSNNNTNSGDSAPHSQLDMEKIPEEQLRYNKTNNNSDQQNGTTIILTPASLNATAGAGRAVGAVATGGSGGDDNGARRVAHNEYKGPRMWRKCVETWPVASEPVAILAIFLALWAIGYILLPQYATPDTGIMRIVFLFMGAQISGILVTYACLPDMLGMLFFGVLYTNVGLADFSGYQPFEAFLREMALINIMLLAGLGLDAKAFKQLWFMILRLTLVPTVAEVTVIAVLAYYLLAMPWLWGILLGLVVTAVSPNVVVTVMLKLKEERLGMNNGIHTLIYAMTTCNDVVAIFLFGVILGVIFSTGSLTEQILQGPIGIGIGVVFGYAYGLMLQILPSPKSNYANGLRFILTILGGTIAVMGSKAIGYPSAGALGCVTVAFVAGIGWKRQQQQQNANETSSSVPQRLDLLWKFLKPVSFALIGKEINFAKLNGAVVFYGALLVLLGSLFRLAFAYISTYGGNLSWKERAYITISGFPKATVQAALGPIALDLARSLNADPASLALASNVLVISVLAIIFTAPLGAILMLRLAPRWLQRADTDVEADVGAAAVVDMMNSSKTRTKSQ